MRGVLAAAGRPRYVRSCRHVCTLAPFVAMAMGLAALLAGSSAQAQVSGTLGFASSERYRGVSTEYIGPLLRAGFSADFDSGVYIEGSTLWMLDTQRLTRTRLLLGLAGRVGTDASIEGGLMRTHFNGDGTYDFTELMLGLMSGDQVARFWVSPHYQGSDGPTAYLEYDLSRPIGGPWRVVGHAGALRYFKAAGGKTRIDGLLGLSWSQDRYTVRLTRDGLLRGAPPDDDEAVLNPAGWVLTASMAF